jgi:hypothetical protein
VKQYFCDKCEREVSSPLVVTVTDSEGESTHEFCGHACHVDYFAPSVKREIVEVLQRRLERA